MSTRHHLLQVQEVYFKVTLASIILAKAFEREQRGQMQWLHRLHGSHDICNVSLDLCVQRI